MEIKVIREYCGIKTEMLYVHRCLDSLGNECLRDDENSDLYLLGFDDCGQCLVSEEIKYCPFCGEKNK